MTYTDQLSAAQRHHDNAATRDSEAIKARELAAALVHAADFYDAQMAAVYPVEVEA